MTIETSSIDPSWWTSFWRRRTLESASCHTISSHSPFDSATNSCSPTPAVSRSTLHSTRSLLFFGSSATLLGLRKYTRSSTPSALTISTRPAFCW